MLTTVEDKIIIPAEFPELAKLVWNRDPSRPIDPATALALYERNWRFVDRDNLTPAETELLHALAEVHGGGHLLVD